MLKVKTQVSFIVKCRLEKTLEKVEHISRFLGTCILGTADIRCFFVLILSWRIYVLSSRRFRFAVHFAFEIVGLNYPSLTSVNTITRNALASVTSVAILGSFRFATSAKAVQLRDFVLLNTLLAVQKANHFDLSVGIKIWYTEEKMIKVSGRIYLTEKIPVEVLDFVAVATLRLGIFWHEAYALLATNLIQTKSKNTYT